jgi:hypothetical protein
MKAARHRFALDCRAWNPLCETKGDALVIEQVKDEWPWPLDDGTAAMRAFCGQAEELSTAIIEHHATTPAESLAEKEMLKAARRMLELVKLLDTVLPKALLSRG